jgi:hypothetical protein
MQIECKIYVSVWIRFLHLNCESIGRRFLVGEVLFAFFAFRAGSLHKKAGFCALVAVGERDGRDGNILDTIGKPANVALEVNVIMSVVGATAGFFANSVAESFFIQYFMNNPFVDKGLQCAVDCYPVKTAV